MTGRGIGIFNCGKALFWKSSAVVLIVIEDMTSNLMKIGKKKYLITVA
jgi:hypothetical protein